MLLAGPVAAQDSPAGSTLYTTQNLWYENPLSLWCINYKVGDMIPAGTEVAGVSIAETQAGRRTGAEKEAITFTRVEDGQQFYVNITAKYHPGKTIEDYKQLLFSEKDFGALTEGLSDDEIEAIQRGVVIEGMSKRAVQISYGIPPEHKTPSTKENRWYYWVNRFRSKQICFDDTDQAIDCSKLKMEGQL